MRSQEDLRGGGRETAKVCENEKDSVIVEGMFLHVREAKSILDSQKRK